MNSLPLEADPIQPAPAVPRGRRPEFTDDPMLDAGEIEVQVKNGEVTLTGTVSDRLAKRHAEDMIERVSGVRDVQNNIKVKDRNTGGSSGRHASPSA